MGTTRYPDKSWSIFIFDYDLIRTSALRELLILRVAGSIQVYSVAGGVQVYSVTIAPATIQNYIKELS